MTITLSIIGHSLLLLSFYTLSAGSSLINSRNDRSFKLAIFRNPKCLYDDEEPLDRAMKQGRFCGIAVCGIYRQKSPYFLVFLDISWYFLVFLGISWYFLVAFTRARATKDTFIGRFIGTRDSRFTVVTKCSLMNGRNANVRNARRRSNDVRRSSIWWNTAETRPLEKRGLSRARQTVAAVWYRSADKSRYLVSRRKNLVFAGY